MTMNGHQRSPLQASISPRVPIPGPTSFSLLSLCSKTRSRSGREREMSLFCHLSPTISISQSVKICSISGQKSETSSPPTSKDKCHFCVTMESNGHPGSKPPDLHASQSPAPLRSPCFLYVQKPGPVPVEKENCHYSVTFQNLYPSQPLSLPTPQMTRRKEGLHLEHPP
jgi:hypothetical protein